MSQKTTRKGVYVLPAAAINAANGVVVKMKKRVLVFAVFFASFAVLISCTSAPIVFDETLPDEAMVTIYWLNNDPRPIAYNGIGIDWGLRGHFLGGLVHNWNPIRIPAGYTTFEVTGLSFNASWRWNWDHFTFSFYFSEGGTYTIHIPMGSVDIHKGKSAARGTLITSFSPEWN